MNMRSYGMPFSAYPEIVSRFSGRILTWSTFNPIVDYVKDTLGKKEGTKILEKVLFLAVFLIFLNYLAAKGFIL